MKLKEKSPIKVLDTYKKRLNDLESYSMHEGVEYYIYYSPYIGILSKNLTTKESTTILKEFNVTKFRHCFDSLGHHVLLYRTTKGLRIMFHNGVGYENKPLPDLEDESLFLDRVGTKVLVLTLNLKTSILSYVSSEDYYSTIRKLDPEGKESLKGKWIKYFSQRVDGTVGVNFISDIRILPELIGKIGEYFSHNVTYIELPISLKNFTPVVKSKKI